MGTDDIDIDVDADSPDVSEYTLSGTALTTQGDSFNGYIQWNTASGKYYQSFLKNAPTSFKMRFRGSVATNQPAGS